MPFRIAILGASGYTGAELVRLVHGHPELEIVALSADRKAGMAMGEVFPHLAPFDLPPLRRIEEIDFAALDLVFAALPHGVTQKLVRALPDGLKVVDLSADFRLADPAAYEKWYGRSHAATDLQPEAAFGIPELHRERIAGARLTANAGCYVTCSLLPLVPLVAEGAVAGEDIVIDAKSGVSGAGRSLRENLLFCEVDEGLSAYGLGGHRHMAEIDQELARAAGHPVIVSFTPHLVPMSRGMMATIHARGDAAEVHRLLAAHYADEPFVTVLPPGRAPTTRHVVGSNRCVIGVVADRVPGRVIIVSVIDNLVKGASGQAVQNANVMLGLDERAGLDLVPLFP